MKVLIYLIKDNLNTYYNNKMDISYFINENISIGYYK